MMLVVPPHAAARVPVSNVSIAAVPPNGSSICVCASMPPGITYLPVASRTLSTDAATSVPSSSEPGCSTAAIAVELPVVAHLLHHVEVEVPDDDLLVRARAALADEVAARVDHLAGAVE